MTQFKVYYGDMSDPTKTIQANNHREAAVTYFKMFPRNEDRWIFVVEKGFRKRKNRVMYRTTELFSEQIRIDSCKKIFDERKLDSYSLQHLKFIRENHPEWLNNIFNCYEIDEKHEAGFLIKITNPFQHYHPLEISTDNFESHLISFGFSWMDWYELRYYSDLNWFEWKRNAEAVFETVELVVNAIIEEELISANAKWTKGLGYVNGIFLTEEEYNLTIEQNTLLQAISWKGTYNYPKNS